MKNKVIREEMNKKAEWRDDQYGGTVVGEHKDCGAVEDGKSYFILSGNGEMTMKAMDSPND